jgi:hypothetical protein
MGEERDTLEDVIEPFLLQNAFVTRTRQGRRATKLAYEHLGMKYVPPKPGNGDGNSLFAPGEERRDEDRGDEKDDWKDDRRPQGTR